MVVLLVILEKWHSMVVKCFAKTENLTLHLGFLFSFDIQYKVSKIYMPPFPPSVALGLYETDSLRDYEDYYGFTM